MFLYLKANLSTDQAEISCFMALNVEARRRQSETVQRRDSHRSSSPLTFKVNIFSFVAQALLLRCESSAFVLRLGMFALIIHVSLLFFGSIRRMQLPVLTRDTQIKLMYCHGRVNNHFVYH